MSALTNLENTAEERVQMLLDNCVQNLPTSQKSQASRVSSPEKIKYHNSPVTSQIQIQTHTCLSNAHKLGALDAKQIIEMFKKKKDEMSTQFSDSSEINSFEENIKNTSYPIQKDNPEEEFSEKLMFVRDLDNQVGTVFMKSRQDNIETSNFNQCVHNLCRQKYCELLVPEKKCFICENIPAENKPVTKNNVAIQQNSIFTIESNDTKRCAEVQYSEKDTVYQESKKSNSNIFAQHYSKDTILQKYSQVAMQDEVLSTTTDNNGKVKKLLKLLICNQRNKKSEIWKKYIHELETRHRPHIRVQSTNERFDDCDHESIIKSRAPSPRRVQSTFVYDDYSSRGISSDLTSHDQSKHHENNSPGWETLTNNSGYPCSQRRSNVMTSQLDSPLEYGDRRINPFCFPSLISNTLNMEYEAKPKMRKLCRNIYHNSLGREKNTDLAMRPKTEQSISDLNEFHSEHLNGWLERPIFKGNKRFYPENDSLYRQFNDSNLYEGNLQAVPEENNLILKSTNKMKSEAPLNYKPTNCKNIIIKKTENNKNSKTSLNLIENKLDTLIESIHALINEVKQSKSNSKKKYENKLIFSPFTKFNSSRSFKNNEAMNKSKSDPVQISAGDNLLKSVGEIILASDINAKGIISSNMKTGCDIKVIVCSKTRTKSTNTPMVLESQAYSKEVIAMEKVKERSRNHHIKCDEYPHALQVTVDFLVKDPTKKQLQKSKKRNAETISQEIADRCVNTEPLTLRQISQEAFKFAWSVMPLVDYLWSFLPIPQLCTSTSYMCEYCKQTFQSAYELSEHIKIHYVNEKDCVICRELSKETSKRTIRAIIPLPKTFACQFCGQVFGRAYARQLHETTCKQNHQTKESLVILS